MLTLKKCYILLTPPDSTIKPCDFEPLGASVALKFTNNCFIACFIILAC